MSKNISISLTTGTGIEIYALEAVTPEVFDRLDRLGGEVIVCPKGDLNNLYYIHWTDKGCDENGVYYKGFCCKAHHMGGCGHYDGVWFNRNTFREAVKDFIDKGGDWVLPCHYGFGYTYAA